jgi:protocatechuate 3,4-dioxygenase beta subunit
MKTNPSRRNSVSFELRGLFALFLVTVLPLGKPAVAGSPLAPPAVHRQLRIITLDQASEPIAGAKIHISVWSKDKNVKPNRDYDTNTEGLAVADLPDTFYILRVWARKESFAPLCAAWEQAELASGGETPAEYVFRLEPAVTAGGRIVDEQGKPISQARVSVMITSSVRPAKSDGRVAYQTTLAWVKDSVITDGDGRWEIKNVPKCAGIELGLNISHPDFADQYFQEAQKASGVTTKALLEHSAVITLKRGVIVRGRVTDPAGKPIERAYVDCGEYDADRQAHTDHDGNFRLPALMPKNLNLTIIAPGWAPQMRQIYVREGLPSQAFRLEQGKILQLRIVDGSGKPVPKAAVMVEKWKGSDGLRNPRGNAMLDKKIPRETDAKGVWEWRWSPDGSMKLEVSATSFAPQELEIQAGAPPRTVVLKSEHRITGEVTDAITGKPIPSFTVIQIDIFRKDSYAAERLNAVAGRGGRLDYLAYRTDIPLRLRIEAPGYRSQDGPEFRVGDDASRRQDFRLQPSPPIAGLVRDQAGRPVAGASVMLATLVESVQLREEHYSHRVITDAAGRFRFPDSGEQYVIVAQGAAGFAEAAYPAGQHDAGALTLRPWASVRGQLQEGGRPISGARVYAKPIRIDSIGAPTVDATLWATTDAQGNFTFEHIPSGPTQVTVFLGPWRDEGFRSGPSVPLDLAPGEHAEVRLGDSGATLTGKVTLAGKVPKGLECTYSLNYLVRREAGIRPPESIARMGFDARNGWRTTWTKSREGTAYLSTLHYWFVKLSPEGKFLVSGVPPGDYDLAIAVYAKPDG